MKHSYIERLSREDIEYIKNWLNEQHSYIPVEHQYKKGFSYVVYPSMNLELMKIINDYNELAHIINNERFDEGIRAHCEDKGNFSEVGKWRECPVLRLMYV
jgi:hypothetical protein